VLASALGSRLRFEWAGILTAAVVVLVATIVSRTLLGSRRLEDVVMVYLLGVVIVSMRHGYGPSLSSAVLSVLCFDFFFVHPHFTFAVADAGHIVTFGVMFLVAVVISGLSHRVRDHAERAIKATQEAQRAELQVRSEQVRNAVLSSISHDLRTPLAVVAGAASSLRDDTMDDSLRRELADTIVQEAERLNHLVQNVLDMTRLEGGALQVRRQWHVLEEVIGNALSRTDRLLAERRITTSLPAELCLIPLDNVLIEQVLVNLLENAARYTPPGTGIDVSARLHASELELEVADRGPGIAEAEANLVFDKFYRSPSHLADSRGAGLGLTICRGIVAAHGGRICVKPREGGGAKFLLTIPIEGKPPLLAAEGAASAAAQPASLT
jgi:K+-sensing histidine kinase KdpD